MKICLLAPSPVPFVMGGAEKLFLGIVDAINHYTPHAAELIKIPVFEHSFWGIIEGYKKFSYLNLDHFDLVLSTKYPAWMIKHKNHHVYMQHKLRGFYDLYHIVPTGLEHRCVYSPPPPLPDHPALDKLYKIISIPYPSRSDLDALFKELDRLKQKNLPDNLFSFPGPIIREIVHFMDRVGLSPDNVVSYAAISKTVAQRKDYFPEGVDVKVIYHPTSLKGLVPGEYRYIFTVSRLSDLKRMDLLIKAYLKVKTKIPFFIAGTGSEEYYLKRLAKNDNRIKFLGFVSDERLVGLYKDAYFVPFIPYDEDYGLITIEAMHCAKPVLTCTDSGGVAEIVEKGMTGEISPPEEQAISWAIQDLVDNPALVKDMGKRAKHRVKDITWPNFIKKLMDHLTLPGKNTFYINNKKTKKIVVLNTFPVYPPVQGGQLRIYHLYKHLAPEYDVTLITLGDFHSAKEVIEIAPAYREIRIPKSNSQVKTEEKLENLLTISCGDIAAIHSWEENISFIETLKSHLKDTDIAILSHPYLFYALKEFYSGPVIYDAQDVEIDLKTQSICHKHKDILDKIREVEKNALEISELVITCSDFDLQRFLEIYNVKKDKFLIVENGIDLSEVSLLNNDKLKLLRKKLKFNSLFVAFFIGSLHPPNVEATRQILDMAQSCNHILFLIAGTVCNVFTENSCPSNVRFLGPLEEEKKRLLLNVVDIGLNPIITGSGTNIKVLEYAAYTLPVLTTPFGIRGLCFNDHHMLISEIAEFKEVLKRYSKKDKEELYYKAKKAREVVEKKYDWRILGEKLKGKISDS